MNETGISDEERTLAAFVDLVFEDPDFVDIEFEAIIAGSWDEPVETSAPERPGYSGTGWGGIRARMSPTTGGPPLLKPWSTIRSPPTA